MWTQKLKSVRRSILMEEKTNSGDGRVKVVSGYIEMLCE